MKPLRAVLTIALLLALGACTGQDYIKAESAALVNPEQKAEQCPETRGYWTYTLQEKPTDPFIQKQFYFSAISVDGFGIQEKGHLEHWVIDGQTHKVHDGDLTVSGYCDAGVINIDVLDAGLNESHIQIQLMDDAGTGLWIETKGLVATRATLTKVPVAPIVLKARK